MIFFYVCISYPMECKTTVEVLILEAPFFFPWPVIQVIYDQPECPVNIPLCRNLSFSCARELKHVMSTDIFFSPSIYQQTTADYCHQFTRILGVSSTDDIIYEHPSRWPCVCWTVTLSIICGCPNCLLGLVGKSISPVPLRSLRGWIRLWWIAFPLPSRCILH